jgi:RNA polymerase sigma factor (sigma-70 family)
MIPAEDTDLLRRYATHGDEAAFAELVRRHLNLVYGAALRRVGSDAHLAQDVAQQVFTALARNASTLSQRPTLAGWLYTTTRFAAAQVVRGERRRRTREQEAHTMQELSSAPESNADWERLRPLVDGAMDALTDRDREAVLLRFFEGRSFANIGAALRLTEDAARMRVERALDKLHAVLARRGVTSTSAALGMILANQVAVGAPAGLAATITGAALAGSAAAAGTAGILAFMSSSKVVAGLGAGATAAALTVAVVQHDGKKDAELELAAADQQRHALRIELAGANARLAQVERRAAEAEKDSGDLLKAVEALRTERAAQASGASKPGPTGGIVGMVGGPSNRSSPDDQERVAQERLYQQQLAKRRAEEAKARARIDEDGSKQDATTFYARLIETAGHLAENAEFQEAIRMYNRAMQIKPAALPVTAEVKQLQATLAAQNAPVEVTLTSDGLTWVSIANHRSPHRLSTDVVKTLPGNYEVIGRRTGYQDVVIPIQVRNGVPAPTISVTCTVPVAP